jgi:hypothetical protein
VVDVEIIAIGITLLMHLIGAGVLVWALLDGDKVDWRSLRPGSDEGGWDEDPDDGPRVPPAPRGGSGLPLPDARPSPVRLREPGRLGDHAQRPARRPDHERDRPRVPEPG